MRAYRSEVGAGEFHIATREYFNGRTVAVCGGSGFIGSHVVEQLLVLGAHPVVPTRHVAPAFLEHFRDYVTLIQCDLENLDETRAATAGTSVIIDLAARMGGVEFNGSRPASQFDQNLRPFMNTIQAAVDNNIERILVTSSACVYAHDCPVPTPETEGFVGVPESTNLGYGWAKRMEEFLGWACAQEYGLSVAIARAYNAYGPRDDFRPDRCHVIPALIRKALTSTDGCMPVWGDGSATRAFLYVDDFARGLLEITARYACCEALNLGTDEIHTIRDTAYLIANLTSQLHGKLVEPIFNDEGPAGQQFRGSDTSKLSSVLGFSPKVSLEDGLRSTIQWFAAHEDYALRTHT